MSINARIALLDSLQPVSILAEDEDEIPQSILVADEAEIPQTPMPISTAQPYSEHNPSGSNLRKTSRDECINRLQSGYFCLYRETIQELTQVIYFH